MSLSRTPSATLLPTSTSTTSATPVIDTNNTNKKNINTVSIEYAHAIIATGGITADAATTPQALATGTSTSVLPPASGTKNKGIPRTKITMRERSTSNPVLLRPVKASAETPSSRTPEGKKSSIASIASGNPMPSTPPRLVKKGSQPLLKTLTPAQQLASDLADLVYKVMLKKQDKPGKPDDTLLLTDLPLSLQRDAGISTNTTTSISGMMQEFFIDDLKKSGAWKIAGDIAKKIKVASFRAHDESSQISEYEKQETLAMLRVLTASFAGAFFNVSGNDHRHRLPASLVFFLEAADHRLIRQQLSGDSATRLEHSVFMQKRKDLQNELLLNAFLIPAVLMEFFPSRGTMESDVAGSHIIASLYDAFLVSVKAFLSESIRNAPADVASSLQQRRIAQLNRKPENEKKVNQKDVPPEKGRTKPLLTKELQTSPNKQQRAELRLQLQKTVKRLSPQSFTKPMLAAIKSYNNERAASGIRFNQLAVLREWIKIALSIDASHAVIPPLQRLINELVELEHQQDELTVEMLKIDVLTKLTESELQGKPLPLERAQPLPEPGSPRMTPNPQSSTAIPPSTSSATTSPTATTRSETISPRVSKHQRSRTANSAMPVARAAIPALTAEERQALIQAYPTLLMAAVRKAASRHGSNVVAAIKENSRHKFLFPLASFPQALHNKLPAISVAGTKDDAVSHAELLKLLFLENVKSSEGGRKLLEQRSVAIAANAMTLQQQLASDDPDSIKRSMMAATFTPLGTAAVSAIFAGGWQHAGLPAELLELWQVFDSQLVDWATSELKLGEATIDELRSMLGFDLLITRLTYPVSLGTNDAPPSLAVIRFSDAVREAMLKQWPVLFNDFKRRQESAIKKQ